MKRLVVVGTGLIGGSFARAARQARLFDEILGVEPDAARAATAVAAGIVDRIVDTVPAAADAVLLAVPSDLIDGWVVRLADHAGIVFDAGSVKGAVLDRVRATLGRIPPRFVPCHPIAGSEQSGPAAASAELFAGHEAILTATAETAAAAVDAVAGWWRAVGARVTFLDPDEHDRILALTSHLPHLVAFAYLQQVTPAHLEHAAGGFRDFSRIAASDPAMWAPIFTLNGAAVLGALDGLQAELDRLRALIERDDRAGLGRLIEDSRTRRRAFVPPGDRSAAGSIPVITIDGPSGSGKGTVASLLARRLGWHLLDSGALYRIVAAVARERGVPLDDAQALAALARGLEIVFADERVFVDGADLTRTIRTEESSQGASQVAVLQPVRDAILDLQRAQCRPPGLVADGRDMGTVVFPDAPLKVFLDASAEVRAERRYNQLKNNGLSVSLAALLANIRERDERDRRRAVAPLRPAEDSVLIDSTELSIDEVLGRVLEAARVRGLVART
ncbi:MAG: (d)CMP kinase [Pseudomonadales bacterium]|nr:(d)CMP kinase [Pseudomonadales bacterium]